MIDHARTGTKALSRVLVASLLVCGAAAQGARMAPPNVSAPGPQRIEPIVLVVDPTPGAGDFTEVAAAVAAADEETLVLVRSGTYAAPVQILGRAVTVHADEGAVVSFSGRLEVLDVPAGAGVAVRGIELAAGFTLQNCTGPVRLVDCHAPAPAEGAPAPPGTFYFQWPECGSGVSAQRVIDCAAVTLVDCGLHGADGILVAGWDGTPGMHALQVEASNVALYGGELRGGHGHPAVSSGHFPVAAGAGGDGLHVEGSGSVIRLCGVFAAGGTGGTFVPGSNGDFGVTFGCDGVDSRVDSGSVVDSCPSESVTLALNGVARTGAHPLYTIDAPVGADVFLMVSPIQDWRVFTPTSGYLHVGAPITPVPLGTMSDPGTLTRPFPALGPLSLRGHRRFEVQAYATVNGIDLYSEARTLVVVDPLL